MTNRIRQATLDDSEFLVSCLLAMLADMESYGGQAVAEVSQVRSWLKKYTNSWLPQKDHVFLLAEPEETGTRPVGLVEAYVAYPDEAFVQVRTLHIAALYVQPERRHMGLGRKLLQAAIQWGRENNCEEVELNVLAGNPARKLYEGLGFAIFEVKERLKLSRQ